MDKESGFMTLRLRRGFETRKSLSDGCGVKVQRIYEWESGRRDPRTMRFDTAKRVADALGVTLGELWDELASGTNDRNE